MSPPAITVVVPARDAAATLPDTLAGLTAQRHGPPFEVIVVDDGSRDGTAEIAEAAAIVDRVLRTGPGAGPGAARNLGVNAARADRIAFLDADCRPGLGWLAAGYAALDRAQLVVGHTRPRSDRSIGPFDRTVAVRGPSALFEAANLFADRALLARLGGFERWLGPAGGKELGEDVWLGWRARRAGASIAFCTEAIAEHEVFARTAAAYVAERWRLRYFPAMTRRIPELRSSYLHRRVFLNPRTARFDAAIAGLVVALGTRQGAPLLAALPYARTVYSDARTGVGLAGVAADTVGLVALATGSVRYRSPLL